VSLLGGKVAAALKRSVSLNVEQNQFLFSPGILEIFLFRGSTTATLFEHSPPLTPLPTTIRDTINNTQGCSLFYLTYIIFQSLPTNTVISIHICRLSVFETQPFKKMLSP
jgi:hypothetical protein